MVKKFGDRQSQLFKVINLPKKDSQNTEETTQEPAQQSDFTDRQIGAPGLLNGEHDV